MRILLAVVGAGAFVVAAAGLIALAANAVAAAPEAAQPMAQMDVAVTMADYSISPRHMVVQAGQPVRFVVNNVGTDRHRFNVTGFDERWRAEQDQPGETAVVEATFTRPGVYQLYCSSSTDAGRHREIGSVGTLTVVEPGQDAALQVPVTMGDYWFNPVAQVAVAGQRTRFSLTSVDELPHSFVVAGYGEEWRSPTVRPGTPVSWDLTIERPGIYEVFCWFTMPQPHKDQGMVGVLEVLPGGGAMMMPGP